MVTVACARCGKEIQRLPSQLNLRPGQQFYCSRSCYWAAEKVTLTCAHCGKEFQELLSQVDPSFKNYYCGNDCAHAGSRIPDGQPMSERTLARRKKDAGLTRPYHPFNEDFFFTWSDSLAWLLGLIWSDGCLLSGKRPGSGNTVHIVSKDRDLIEMVGNLIGQEDGVIPRKGGNAFHINFTSVRVTQFLRELGLTESKSLTANWPEIPAEFRGAFVRGVLDGDGSVFLRSYRPTQQAPTLFVQFFGAAPAMRAGLHAWFSEQGLRYSPFVDKNGVWRITITEYASLRTLYTLLYPHNQVPALQRKRVNYDRWIATPRTKRGIAVSAGIAAARRAKQAIDGNEGNEQWH